jgi:hypothetical protein
MACSTARWLEGRRVSPNSDSRLGRSTRPGSASSRRAAAARRSAGLSTPMRCRSRLPDVRGLPLLPFQDHLGAVHAVVIEQICEMPDGREAPHRPFTRDGAKVVREILEPGLAQVGVHDLHQGPGRAGRNPGIVVRFVPARRCCGPSDQGPGKRKIDIGTYSVPSGGGRAKPVGQPLGEPPLDTAGGDGNDLGHHGIGQRLGEQVAEHPDQLIGALRSVHVQHGRPA